MTTATAAELLAALRADGLEFTINPSCGLHVRPRVLLTDEARTQIRLNRDELVHLVTDERTVRSMPEPVFVGNSGMLEAVLPTILAAPAVGLDTETTRERFVRNNRVCYVQMATTDNVFVVDVRNGHADVRLLRPLMDLDRGRRRQLLGFNLSFDLGVLWTAGVEPPACGLGLFDCQIAQQLYAAGTPFGYLDHCTLEEIAQRVLGIELDKSHQLDDWTLDLTPERLQYAALDAWVLLQLAEEQQRGLEQARLERAMRLEMRALPAFTWLRVNGVPFDGERWRRRSDASVLLRAARRQALADIGGDVFGPLDARRPLKQTVSAAKLLKAVNGAPYNLGLPNTAEGTLAPFRHEVPLVGAVLDFRDAHKNASNYGLKLAREHWDPRSGRIFAGYVQLGAVSGRASCSSPNLQNIPRLADFRGCFIAPPGHYLVHVDLGQAELRVLAEVTADENMIRVLNAVPARDIHDETARAVFKLAPGVKPDGNQRKAGKTLNFGISYGMGAAMFGKRLRALGIATTDAKASKQHGAFFEAYPGVKKFHVEQKRHPSNVSRSLSGRRRLNCDKFTYRVNTPIQAGAADCYKAGLALLWERRGACPGVQLVLSTHDDVVVAVPDSIEPSRAMAWVQSCLEDGMRAFLKLVKPVAEPEVGPDWGWFSLPTAARERGDLPEGFQAKYGTGQTNWVCPHALEANDLRRGYCRRCDCQEDRVVRDLLLDDVAAAEAL